MGIWFKGSRVQRFKGSQEGSGFGGVLHVEEAAPTIDCGRSQFLQYLVGLPGFSARLDGILLASALLTLASMAGVRDPREFAVWKLSEELRRRLEDVLERPAFAAYPKLRGQLDEASERICPNLAEGFARYLPRDHARFVRVAAGSLSEIIQHLNRARRHNLITAQELLDLQLIARRARGAATGLIRYLQTAEPPHIPPPPRRVPSPRKGVNSSPKRGEPEP